MYAFDVVLKLTGPALRDANIHHSAATNSRASTELAMALLQGQSV